jgi:peptide/nickel transport system permease protein
MVERRYILRPTLPYILTNFTLLLIGFWQMTIALEKILNWPGIGRLYIISLPNFFGDKFYPGVMPITLGIVVLFAYLLGLTVLVLELSYAVVDPQIRLGSQGPAIREPSAPGRRTSWPWQRRTHPQGANATPTMERGSAAVHISRPKVSISERFHSFVHGLESLKPIWRELSHSPSAMFGLVVIVLLVLSSIYAVTAYPYNKLVDIWYMKALSGRIYVPRLASPAWVNIFRKDKLPPSIIINSNDPAVTTSAGEHAGGTGKVTITYSVAYPYADFPQDIVLYFDPKYAVKQPFAQLTWITPDGREIDAGRTGVLASTPYSVTERLNTQRLVAQNKHWQEWFVASGNYPTPGVDLLFADPAQNQPVVVPGTYKLRIDGVTFEPGSEINAQFVLLGQVYGAAGTDNMRRDLVVPLLWGMPFALIFGLLGAFVTTILSMTLAAMAAWYGGWLDDLIQRLVEANMVLPIIAIGVLIYAYFNVSIWAFLGIVVVLNVFASPTKSFRAAFLQVRNAPYIEAARAYGASDGRIILHYLVPRILPMFIPQLVTLIPSYVFLEATLGIFNVRSDYPTWGRTIYDALRYGSHYGSSYWVLEPLALLLLTGVAFAMFGFALEKVLNPRTGSRA